MSLIARDSQRRWVNGIIPFKLDMSVSPALQNAISQAQQAWEAVTPVRFVAQTNEPDFILFRNDPSAVRCSSPVGRRGGQQEIKCTNKPTPADTLRAIVHEIGHAIGLEHEQRRQDRDVWVAVSAAGIAQRPQDFARLDDELMVGPYDLTSVMHYPWTEPPTPLNPSPVPRELTKITPLPPAVWPNPTAPSGGDAQGVQYMYGIVPDQTPIAAHKRHSEHMEVWVVGGDGLARGAWFDDMWQTWYQLPERSFPVRGNLAVLGRHRDHMELFGVGVDSQLHGIWWDGQWRKWYTLGAPTIAGLPPGTPALLAGTPLAVHSRFRDHMEVWVVGADGQVYHIWWNGNDWQPWGILAGALFPPGAPLAVHSRNDDHMEIWGIDVNGVLQHNWWDGNWQGWFPLTTPVDGFRLVPGGNLAVLGRNDDHMEVWSIGGDDRLHGIWWDGNWQDWYTLDGPASFPPGGPLVALSRDDDYMDVWVVGDDDRLHGVWWNGTWQPLPQHWYVPDATPIRRRTPLAPLSRNDDHMEVWCVAPARVQPDNIGVQGIWWDGQWHPFFRVI